MRGLILAFGFLTRIPVPPLRHFRDEELAASAVWFPLVGLAVGALLVVVFQLASTSSWLAAWLVTAAWLAISGGLHLDGAADLADALGAAHRDPERFHAVLKDPHTGAFGVMAIVMILFAKLVGAASLPDAALWSLLLIPAWARLGSVYWSQALEALAPGSGERFSWQVSRRSLWLWGAALFVLSMLLVSTAFAVTAVAVLWLWRAWLGWRLGGMSGDCLGAGIEYSECAMLIAAGLL